MIQKFDEVFKGLTTPIKGGSYVTIETRRVNKGFVTCLLVLLRLERDLVWSCIRFKSLVVVFDPIDSK